MAAPVVIPADTVARFVDIGVHFLETACIGVIAWLVRVGKCEILEAIDSRATKAAGQAVMKIDHKVDALSDWAVKHERLDDDRHIEVMAELKVKNARA